MSELSLPDHDWGKGWCQVVKACLHSASAVLSYSDPLNGHSQQLITSRPVRRSLDMGGTLGGLGMLGPSFLFGQKDPRTTHCWDDLGKLPGEAQNWGRTT